MTQRRGRLNDQRRGRLDDAEARYRPGSPALTRDRHAPRAQPGIPTRPAAKPAPLAAEADSEA